MAQGDVGIYASQISGHLSAPAFQGDYWSLATATLSSAASSITFTGIPQNYTHLQLRGIARSTNASTADQAQLQMNGDTSTASYTFHQVAGDGASVSYEGYGTGVIAGVTPVIRFTGGNATSGTFGVTVIDILDYTDKSKYKTVRALTGYDLNGSGNIKLVSGVRISVDAINSLSITIQAGGNFAAGSSLALYGIK